MERSVSFDMDTIFYRTHGDGYPVVLIHGFGEDGSIWQNQVRALENEYSLIIPDLPGSGISPMLRKTGADLVDYADCIKWILDSEGIDECIMIGHSMGGYITLAFEEKYPLINRSFGLFHSSAYADDAEKIATRKKGIAFIETNGAPAFLKTSIPNLFFNSEKSNTDIDKLLSKGEKFTAASLIQYYEAMISRPDRTNVLLSSKKSVFLLAGQHDKAVPFQHSLQQSHLSKQTFLTILRYSAHMGMLEETSKTNECLRNILQLLSV